MKKLIIVGAIVAAMTSTFAMAADSTGPKHDVTQKPVSQWTCDDFLSVDESFYPTAVGIAGIITSKNKVEDSTIDVQGIMTATPAIIESCKKDPKSSFLQRVEEFGKSYSQISG
ncbi:acid-activated periplasmic chaperone HdeA [Morganella morganii]|uniref:acid-activated periplasmic chaperone HdeA n=1 Tax=Morganella morganii TaxID=582 RepID=UPI0021CE6DF9|nr:acid-activated periplasmic chaperone HdeA [Morganella morganii]MCU6374888.1 acid-resistance protein [Morganella morganii]